MPKIKYTEFQTLLAVKFPHEHDPRLIAHRMNIPASTFYHYIEGLSTFPVDLLPRLYKATEDTEFLNFILNDTNFMLAPRPEGNGNKSIIEETLDVAGACGALVQLTQEALKDKSIKPHERKKIIAALDKTQKELEDMRKKVGKG